MAPLLIPLLEIGKTLIDRLIPDKEKAAEAQLKLLEMQQSGELAKLAAETKLTEAYLADTASARDREAKVVSSADAPYLNKIITPVLAGGIVGLTFILCGILAFTADGDLKPSQERIIIFIIGALVPICSQVVSYYFGSSRGDAAKDQHIADLMKKG